MNTGINFNPILVSNLFDLPKNKKILWLIFDNFSPYSFPEELLFPQ